MRRSLRWAVVGVVAAMTAVAVLAGAAAPVEATVRTHVFIGAGPFWWGPYHPYWWEPPYRHWLYDPYVPYYYYYYYAPPIVIQEPPVYIQRPAPPEGPYWYYCESAKAYYPTAPSCPEPWIKVPPRPQ